MKKNRIRTSGRNTTTEPTPAKTPSASSDWTKPSGITCAIPACSAPIASSISAIGRSAQANTAWNMTNISAASRIGPITGWSVTLSAAWLQRREPDSDRVAVAAMARADAGHAVYPRLHCLFGEAQRHDVVPDETAPVVNLLGQLGRVARRADDDLDAISPAQVEVGTQLLLLHPRR